MRSSNAEQGHNQDKIAAARLSLYSNLGLMVIKLIAGVQVGSVSILSEAAHSATDLLASGIALYTVRMADRPPDVEHPYGHGKAESLSTLAEALLLVAAAAYIIFEAVQRLITHTGPQRVDLGIGVMAVSAAVNVFVVRYMLRIADRTDSQALKADAQNHRTDIYTALGVLCGLLVTRVTGIRSLDSVLAIGVSLLILQAAWQMMRGAIATLMDSGLPTQEVDAIRKLLDNEPGVRGYHNLRTRKAGAVRYIDAHVMMDDELTLLKAHDLTEKLEDRIREKLPGTEVTFHTEPYRAEQRHQREEHPDLPFNEKRAPSEDHEEESKI